MSRVQKQVSLYPCDIEYLERKSKELGVSVSAYLRILIRIEKNNQTDQKKGK